MIKDQELPQIPLGSRVRLLGKSHVLTLRSNLGRVIEPDRFDGHYIVRLDEPAMYDNGVGDPYELRDVVQAADNLEVLAD